MPGFRHGKKYGPNKRAYRLVCEWCGCGFRSARPETNCCGNAHKLRFVRWVRKHVAKYGTRPQGGPRGDADLQARYGRGAWRAAAT